MFYPVVRKNSKFYIGSHIHVLYQLKIIWTCSFRKEYFQMFLLTRNGKLELFTTCILL